VIIILNGTTSSGKTTVAKALQKLSSSLFLHVSVDAFIDMFPDDYDDLASQKERNTRRGLLLSNLNTCIQSLAGMGHNLIVDHVLDQPASMQTLLRALKAFKVFLIAVRCPLEVLETRERARGDRAVGLARGQFDTIHLNKPYHFEINTEADSPTECAIKILNFIGEQPKFLG